ncbi:MAG: VOC family protein [Herbiconiux sp.]|uniref:VOC family protein n=1 Tax=Herbiconiux sp. TaxID=1871186 RepID=UPI0012079F99|nr:VOC family protein [Herbiconiux sp.]TAJ48624.1 MAG: VOC family protein [Herbiconiux sp.]
MTNLNPYISFRGQAREAGEFYRSVFGGELTVSTFADYQMPAGPDEADWIMHSQLTSSGLTLMISDVPSSMEYTPGNNISVSLSGGADDSEELRGFYEGLSDGGTVTMPLDKAPWGDYFGQVIDRFGINWLVNIAGS